MYAAQCTIKDRERLLCEMHQSLDQCAADRMGGTAIKAMWNKSNAHMTHCDLD